VYTAGAAAPPPAVLTPPPAAVSGGCGTVVVVADAANHRIRLVWAGNVSTLAGGGGLTESETDFSPAGYADGQGTEARFDSPLGLAVDAAGNVFVADTRNHLIRHIDPSGAVRTLAGRVVPIAAPLSGCPPPCLTGTAGYIDGALTTAQFYSPYAVAIGPGTPYTLMITDGDRLRLITRGAQTPFADGSPSPPAATPDELASLDSVITLVGALTRGADDGDTLLEARLDVPRGAAYDAVARAVYIADSSRCRIRRLTPTVLVAAPASCTTRLTDILRPAGCASVDRDVDALGAAVSPLVANMYYGYNTSVVGSSLGLLAGGIAPRCLTAPPPQAGSLLTGQPGSARGATTAAPLDVDEDTAVGTMYLLRCPATPCNDSTAEVWGGETGLYGAASHVCAAAQHAGMLAATAATATVAGDDVVVVAVTLQKGVGQVSGVGGAGPPQASTTAHGITALALPNATRTFSVAPVPTPWNRSTLHTVAGPPAAPLDPSCGYADAWPPTAARLSHPVAVVVVRDTRWGAGPTLLIADAGNHAVRALSPACTQACENGGVCTDADTCTCAPGWSGVDCTAPVCARGCSARRVCTGPDTCTCAPGYSGADCMTALCVQRCSHGGRCVAPDTCACARGWYDTNCTTPVCPRPGGTGGTSRAPAPAPAPPGGGGGAARPPVGPRGGGPGGRGGAPAPGRGPPACSGPDCSKPVCPQGFFRADPAPAYSAPSLWRPPVWEQFVACERAAWCTATNEFECDQLQMVMPPAAWPGNLTATGAAVAHSTCFPVELTPAAVTPFRYENETASFTPYARYSPVTPYGWGPARGANPWSAPFPAGADRQVAWVSRVAAAAGVYACANGGQCTAPDTCVCAAGWVGFDCRTPVCTQGFYYPTTLDPRYPGQGTYRVSRRTLTIWENPVTPTAKFTAYLHNHPNFHSLAADMDSRLALPITHVRVDGLGDDTREGWRRDGWWAKAELTSWQAGRFDTRFNRTCAGAPAKRVDLRTGVPGLVDDTAYAFAPRLAYDNWTVTAAGRWAEAGGECVDEVPAGCFNGGTCVAPNTCACAVGWEGSDCTLPICSYTVADVMDAPGVPATVVRASGVNWGTPDDVEPPVAGDRAIQYRKCPHGGNCSQPEVCACEMGWTGADCSIPLCAQECFHGGVCIAPDVCQCVTTPSAFTDKRGLPLFASPDGEPRPTGWTGYDCNTPVCVQAPTWVPDDDTGQYPVVLATSTNDGHTFQAGCPAAGPYYPPTRTRTSDYLCGNAVWYQGDYAASWAYEPAVSDDSPGRTVRVNFANWVTDANGSVALGPTVAGEGVYACYNSGSCVAPDVCVCKAGWTGYDCNVPMCSHTDATGAVVVGCANGGVCGGPNTCYCAQTDSLLWLVHAGMPAGAVTGWAADDCSMPMCVQGYYDASCTGVAAAGAGQGCYRCANGGTCVAPDTCACAPGWTGYDCRTPVCMLRATETIVRELRTIDMARITAFERDPCGHGVEVLGAGGDLVARGNCTRPNVCTCTCRRRSWRNAGGVLVEPPWWPPTPRTPPPGVVYGSYDCLDGWEGALNDDGSFASCHLAIYVPTYWELNSVRIMTILVAAIVAAVILCCIGRWRYALVQRRRRREARRRAARGLAPPPDATAAAATAAAAAGAAAAATAVAGGVTPSAPPVTTGTVKPGGVATRGPPAPSAPPADAAATSRRP